MGVLPPSPSDLLRSVRTVLRVHGVGGWKSESTLQADEVVQVAGDRLSGFYRRPASERAGDPPVPASNEDTTGPALEAFNWGKYSTQSAIQALWLILLPMAALNIAGWMIPPDRRDGVGRSSRVAARLWAAGAGVSHGIGGSLLRLLGLTLTVEIMLGSVGVFVAVIGEQCAPDQGVSVSCPQAPAIPLSWLPTAARSLVPWLQLPDAFPARIAVLFLISGLVLVLFWVMCYITRRRYERWPAPPAHRATATGPEPAVRPRQSGETQDPRVDQNQPPLSSVGMWRGDERLLRLALIHTGGASAVVALVELALVDVSPWSWPRVLAVLVVVAALVMLVPEGLAGMTTHEVAESRSSRGGRAAAGAVALGGLVAFGVGVVAVEGSSMSAPVPASALRSFIPGWDIALHATLAAQVLLLSGLAVVLAVLKTRNANQARADLESGWGRPFVSGFGALGASALGVGLAAVFTTATVTGAEVLLVTKPSIDSALSPSQQLLPAALTSLNFAAVIFLACLLSTVLSCVLVVLVMVWRGKDLEARCDKVLNKAPDKVLDEDIWKGMPELRKKRERSLRISITLARLVEPAVAGLLVGSVIGVLVCILTYFVPGVRDAGTSREWAGRFTTVLFLGFTALVALLAAELRDQNRRATLGALWDVATFWPRAAHPFAPPCYAERAVPELANRLRWLSQPRLDTDKAQEERRVVLVGYSQGSAISVAALLQLNSAELRRISLVTCACVVRRLYGRAFPTYFGPTQMEILRDRLNAADGNTATHHWRNVWRDTDYLGGWMFTSSEADDTDYWAPDPEFAGSRDGDSSPASLHRHSDFFPDRVVATQVGELLADSPRGDRR